jgi:GTP cyclohydrolase I
MAYKKIDQFDHEVTQGLLKNYKDNLALLGEDPAREGLEKTPRAGLQKQCSS